VTTSPLFIETLAVLEVMALLALIAGILLPWRSPTPPPG
jgi:hypothetical protein